MTLLILLLLFFIDNLLESKSVNGKIYTFKVPEKNLSVRMFQDKQADFGGDVPDYGIVGILQLAKPLNACSTVQAIPMSMVNTYSVFALVVESNSQASCPYYHQVRNCEEAGYDAVIVYNREYSGDLKTMKGSGGDDPVIPSVYVSRFSGEKLKNYVLPKRPTVQILSNPELPLQLYLIPFAVVVGVCFFFMVVFSIFRFVRYRLRQRRSRLSPSNLKKIPTKKFRKGDEYDVCAICLDEYEEGEKIRILPCNHAYHCKCVDPWLLSGKKLCPVCKQTVEPKKQRVHPVNGGSTSSYTEDTEEYEDDDEENQNNTNHIDDSDTTDDDEADERTPLLLSHHTPAV